MLVVPGCAVVVSVEAGAAPGVVLVDGVLVPVWAALPVWLALGSVVVVVLVLLVEVDGAAVVSVVVPVVVPVCVVPVCVSIVPEVVPAGLDVDVEGLVDIVSLLDVGCELVPVPVVVEPVPV